MQAVSTGRRYDVACFNALPWRPNEKHDNYRLAHRHDVLRGRAANLSGITVMGAISAVDLP